MNKYIDDKLIKNEIEEPIIHLESMLDSIIGRTSTAAVNVDKKELIKAFHIVNAFCGEHKLSLLDLNGLSLDSDISFFRTVLSNRLTKVVMHEQKDSYKNLFKKIENSMDDEDYKHIQDLINKLRDKLKEATDFDKDLQRRVLDKLNKLQAELDKDINKLELAKGRLITIADTLGYAHNKALKPIIDSVVELANAIRGVEAKSHGVESSQNILEYNEEIIDVEIAVSNSLEA